MALSGRKEKILEAVVERYINSCEPISSHEIQEKYLPDLSPATIRNELKTLEDMGYLVKPHTSGGRMPTKEAYRLYVEKLMPKRKLTQGELKIVKRYFNRKITELDVILKSTAKVISEITNLTSVVYPQNIDEAIIESIKIVKLSDSLALVIIVTDRGILKDTAASISPGIRDEYFIGASEFITGIFSGYKISQAASPEMVVRAALEEYKQVFDTVYKILKDYSDDSSLDEIVLEGGYKLLQQPEYANAKKAQAMLSLLDAKEELIPVLKNNDDLNFNIVISSESETKEGMPEYAVVTANYCVNGVSIGKAGVIGPMRMDYSKVLSVLDYIGKTINQLPEYEDYEDE